VINAEPREPQGRLDPYPQGAWLRILNVQGLNYAIDFRLRNAAGIPVFLLEKDDFEAALI